MSSASQETTLTQEPTPFIEKGPLEPSLTATMPTLGVGEIPPSHIVASEPSGSLVVEDISNKDELRDKIHNIHNFLRNHGAGYGMNALKVFNIVYGLWKIEQGGLHETLALPSLPTFSKLETLAASKSDGAVDKIQALFYDEILTALWDSPKMRPMLFYEIPPHIHGDTFQHLVQEVRSLADVEKRSNVQLAGKIYEYFIGRDKTAISELGAYFTDRHIVDFVYKELVPMKPNNDGTIPEMIDMFGGSGGFTIGYIRRMIDQAKALDLKIDWETQLKQVHHYDMNEDVIRSAALEALCLTGEFPQMGKDGHMAVRNSFKDSFGNRKFQHIFTNPPYGGDDTKGTSSMDKRKRLIQRIKKVEKDKNLSQERIAQLKAQRKQLEADNKEAAKMMEMNSVSLQNSSRRVQTYAETYGGFASPQSKTKKTSKKATGLQANDKEAVSLLMLMDMLAPSGTAVGVLKQGVFFDPKYTELREHLLTHYNVREVVSVPRDAFENTSVETSILVFDAAPKGGTIRTETVRFSELVVEKYNEDKFSEHADGTMFLEEVEGDIRRIYRRDVTEASFAQISKQKKWALFAQGYPKEETVLKAKDGWEMVALGEVCEFLTGTKHTSSIGKAVGKYPFFTSSQTKERYVDFAEVHKSSIILGQGGNFNIHFSNCFTASKHMCVLQNDDTSLLRLMYYIIPTVQKHIISNGTTISWTNRENLKAFKIPLPKTQDLRTHWTTRVSTPYTAKQVAEKRIVEAEAKVRGMVKEVVETDGACDWVALEDVCEIRNGTRITKRGNTAGQYDVYGGGDKTFTTETKNRDSGTTIIGRFGVSKKCIRTVYTDFFLNDSGCSLHPTNTECERLVLEAVKQLQHTIYDECARGSSQKNMDMDKLKAFKIPLPKDPSFQTLLQPHFDELDTLRQQVKTHEADYKQALVELRAAALEE